MICNKCKESTDMLCDNGLCEECETEKLISEAQQIPTPGPWEFHIHRYPNGRLSGTPYIYAPNGPDTHRHVCVPAFDSGASKEIQAMQEANGYLLAAATELLEACKIALAYMEADADDNQERKDYAQIKAAIAKAQNKG